MRNILNVTIWQNLAKKNKYFKLQSWPASPRDLLDIFHILLSKSLFQQKKRRGKIVKFQVLQKC